MIPVSGVIDIREGERVKLYDFDSLFTYFFEMSLFKRFIVRPVAERIKHGPYFHAFFHLLGQQIEKRIGYRVIAEIEVFQMNVMFGVAYFFEEIQKLLPSAHQKLYFIVGGNWNALLL